MPDFKISQLTELSTFSSGADLLAIVSSGVTKKIQYENLFNSIPDDIFRIADESDPSKGVRFQLSGLTTFSTRTLTVPDESGTIALVSSIGNTLIVDAIYGANNGQSRESHTPFLTITAAQTAASSGDTIIIRTGSYAEGGLGKGGVNYYCQPGVNITYASEIWVGNAISYKVFGYGYFSSTGGDGVGICININNAGNVYIECRGVNGTNLNGGNVLCESGSTLTLRMKEDLTANGYGVYVDASTAYISGRKIICGTSLFVPVGDCVLESRFDENVLLNDGTEAFSYAINYAGGKVDIYGKIVIHEDCATAGTAVFMPNVSGGAVTYYLNIHDDIEVNESSSLVFSAIGSMTAYINFYGRINSVAKTAGTNFSISNANVITTIYNDVIGSVDGEHVIFIEEGSLNVKGLVWNKSNTSGANGIEFNGGSVTLDGAIIKTTHSASVSVNGTNGAQSLYIHKTSFATKDFDSTDITPLIGTLVIHPLI